MITYDAGLLNDYGGGNVEWWHDYIRAELDRSDQHYQAEIDRLRAVPFELGPDGEPNGPCLGAYVDLEAVNGRLIDALRQMVDPLPYFDAEAKKVGGTVNGMIYNSIVGSASYYIELARNALAAIPESDFARIARRLAGG